MVVQNWTQLKWGKIGHINTATQMIQDRTNYLSSMAFCAFIIFDLFQSSRVAKLAIHFLRVNSVIWTKQLSIAEWVKVMLLTSWTLQTRALVSLARPYLWTSDISYTGSSWLSAQLPTHQTFVFNLKRQHSPVNQLASISEFRHVAQLGTLNNIIYLTSRVLFTLKWSYKSQMFSRNPSFLGFDSRLFGSMASENRFVCVHVSSSCICLGLVWLLSASVYEGFSQNRWVWVLFFLMTNSTNEIWSHQSTEGQDVVLTKLDRSMALWCFLQLVLGFQNISILLLTAWYQYTLGSCIDPLTGPVQCAFIAPNLVTDQCDITHSHPHSGIEKLTLYAPIGGPNTSRCVAKSSV